MKLHLIIQAPPWILCIETCDPVFQRAWHVECLSSAEPVEASGCLAVYTSWQPPFTQLVSVKMCKDVSNRLDITIRFLWHSATEGFVRVEPAGPLAKWSALHMYHRQLGQYSMHAAILK